MKRSRRSLGLLLAGMAFSFAVLRATTLPARKTTSQRQKVASADRMDDVLSGAKSNRAAHVPPKARALARGDEPRCDEVISCPVSMTAIVIVLPARSAHAAAGQRDEVAPPFACRRHIGWSGCTAYANGCDHFGCACAERRQSLSQHERLIMGTIKQMVDQAVEAASAATDLLTLAMSLGEQVPSLARDLARANAGR